MTCTMVIKRWLCVGEWQLLQDTHDAAIIRQLNKLNSKYFATTTHKTNNNNGMMKKYV